MCILQVQQAEAVERRKSERQCVFQPPVESSRSAGSAASSKYAAGSESAARGGSWREGDDIDVAAIKKKVSKAMKKVCSLVIVYITL